MQKKKNLITKKETKGFSFPPPPQQKKKNKHIQKIQPTNHPSTQALSQKRACPNRTNSSAHAIEKLKKTVNG